MAAIYHRDDHAGRRRPHRHALGSHFGGEQEVLWEEHRAPEDAGVHDGRQHREAHRALVRAAEDGKGRGAGVGVGVGGGGARVGLASRDGALWRLLGVGLVLGKLGRLVLARDEHDRGGAPRQREEEGDAPAPREHLLVRRERLDHADHQLRHDQADARRREREARRGRRVRRSGALDRKDHRRDDLSADEEALAELEQEQQHEPRDAGSGTAAARRGQQADAGGARQHASHREDDADAPAELVGDESKERASKRPNDEADREAKPHAKRVAKVAVVVEEVGRELRRHLHVDAELVELEHVAKHGRCDQAEQRGDDAERRPRGGRADEWRRLGGHGGGQFRG